MSDALFRDDLKVTHELASHVVARLRRLGVPLTDEVGRVLTSALPPREPGEDEIEDDEAEAGELVALGSIREVGDGGGRRSIADIIKARAGARRGR